MTPAKSGKIREISRTLPLVPWWLGPSQTSNLVVSPNWSVLSRDPSTRVLLIYSLVKDHTVFLRPPFFHYVCSKIPIAGENQWQIKNEHRREGREAIRPAHLPGGIKHTAMLEALKQMATLSKFYTSHIFWIYVKMVWKVHNLGNYYTFLMLLFCFQADS